MPWTLIHPFYGWFIIHFWFKANLHSSAVYWTILFGSIFSDMPQHLFLLYHIFICDNVYFTNFGCEGQFISIAKDWTHSLPLSIIISLGSYFIYCKVSYKTLRETFCSCFAVKQNSLNSIPTVTITQSPNTKATMQPTHLTKIVEKKDDDITVENDDITVENDDITVENDDIKLQEQKHDEKTRLLSVDNSSMFQSPSNMFQSPSTQFESPSVQILYVKTYSSITSKRYAGRRHNSFEYTHGEALTCKNCWCVKRWFWKLFAYFFLSVFIHSLIDFPIHHSNAHEQFLPFSSYMWRSPISYYEYKYYGYIFGPIVLVITIVLSIWVFIHKRNDWRLYNLSYYYFWMSLFLGNAAWCCYEIVELITPVYR